MSRYQPAKEFTLSPQAALSIVPKLPDMPLDQLKGVWDNAVRILASKKRSNLHTAANIMLDKIEVEWKRRYGAPVNADDFFKWPSTEAIGGSGRIDLTSLPTEGMLSYLGYRVGSTQGLATNIRCTILSQVFERGLPPVFPRDYLMEWGQPKSAQRLSKLAETLAAFTRNAKRRNNDALYDAIKGWETDLEYLYNKYYIGHFRFCWPTTTIE